MEEAGREVEARAARVRLAVFDVDGVLTDGRLYMGERGEELKVFHVRDGHGLRLLRGSGVEIGVISGRSSPIVEARMRELGVERVHQCVREKLAVFDSMLAELHLNEAQAAFVADDVVDLPVLLRAGLAVAVADAHPLVLRHAHWRSPSPGGRGAVRDVCDLIMHAQGTLEAAYRNCLAGAPPPDPSPDAPPA